MNNRMRGALASLVMGASVMTGAAMAQNKATLATEKDKVSYAVGLDVASSFEPLAPHVDLDAMQRAVANAFAGGQPLQSEEQARATDAALRTALAARAGQRVPGMAPRAEPPVPPAEQVGPLVGDRMVGPSLAAVKDDIGLAVVMQAVRTAFAEGTPLMAQDEAAAAVQGYLVRKQQAQAENNRSQGAAFLAENRKQKGVITTPSGLQYMVLRQGNGPRPMPSDTVRVNYEGKLLDGTVFDSSYTRGEPAVFPLGNVIAGWTEGVALMPVGARYRFWIPSDLAYGANGAPGGVLGPDATLTFDVELLDIAR